MPKSKKSPPPQAPAPQQQTVDELLRRVEAAREELVAAKEALREARRKGRPLTARLR